MTCNVCRREYSSDCDFMQGRCPHHPPFINTHNFRFLILFNSIKAWLNGNTTKRSK